jgi:hypothetical protein
VSLKKSQEVGTVEINKHMTWGFFDSACQGPCRYCGPGFILHLSENRFVIGKKNLGS